MTLNIKEMGQFAKDIVTEAGAALLRMRSGEFGIEDKGGCNNLLTFADIAVEEFLVGEILKKYPTHGIISEEGTFKNESSLFETQWVIDPIDGTTNFIHNFPFYGISVAVVHRGVGLIGAVYNPLTNELFYAEKGNGAYVNGVPLTLAHPISLKEALVTTTMFWDDVRTQNNLHPSIIQIYKETRGLRMVGGAAISLSEIAKGNLNAYVVPMLSIWDYAAGVVILEEAGGTISRLDGQNVSFESGGGSLLAAHPSIHCDLLSIFSEYSDLKNL